MRLYLFTQYHENYGSAEQPFWKAKGGCEYFIQLGSTLVDGEVTKLVQQAATQLNSDTDYTREYLIDWSVEADDYLTQFERDQMEFDGRITMTCMELDIKA